MLNQQSVFVVTTIQTLFISESHVYYYYFSVQCFVLLRVIIVINFFFLSFLCSSLYFISKLSCIILISICSYQVEVNLSLEPSDFLQFGPMTIGLIHSSQPDIFFHSWSSGIPLPLAFLNFLFLVSVLKEQFSKENMQSFLRLYMS